MKKINKAATNYILKSKDTQVNILGMAFLAAIVSFMILKGLLSEKSESELILIMYMLILGMTIITANAMIIDLTVKDKMSNRLEFFLGSGIKLNDLIKTYSLQMFRIASVVPFILFLIFFNLINFEYNFGLMIFFYVSTVFLCYSEILFLNIYSLYATKNKLFKNIVFFGGFILIYLVGVFSENIVSFIETQGLDIMYIILIINLAIGLILTFISRNKLKELKNKEFTIEKGEWE